MRLQGLLVGWLLVAVVGVSLTGIADQPPYVVDPPAFAARSPWQSSQRFGVVEDRSMPVAPMDEVASGIEAQGFASGPGKILEPAALAGKAAFRPAAMGESQETFPQSYDDSREKLLASPARPTMRCVSSPGNFKDAHGYGCESYTAHGWCTATGDVTEAWPSWWGPTLAGKGEALSAAVACCVCGGGLRTLVSSVADERLEDRALVAAADSVPQSFMHGRQVGVTPRAPQDAVPAPFVAYFNDLLAQKRRPLQMGLSGRFYGFPPGECSTPEGSAIVRGIDYRVHGDGGSRTTLDDEIAISKKSGAGYFWGRWTGTLNIFTPGVYTFNLRVGFDSQSSFNVDAQRLITRGQCWYGRDAENCAARGCVWLHASESCVPYATPEELQAELAAGHSVAAYKIEVKPPSTPAPRSASAAQTAGAHIAAGASSATLPPAPQPEGASAAAAAAAEATALLQKRRRLRASSAGGAPAPGVVGSPPAMPKVGAYAVGAPAPVPPIAASSLTASSLSPSPALGSASSPSAIVGRIPATQQGGWLAAPAPSPGLRPGQDPDMTSLRALHADDIKPNEVYLAAGGHCLDILVEVSPTGRTLQLEYQGADTAGAMTITPGQVLWCDPVIQACDEPGMDACAAFRGHCSAPERATSVPPAAAAWSGAEMRATPAGGAGLAPGAGAWVAPQGDDARGTPAKLSPSLSPGGSAAEWAPATAPNDSASPSLRAALSADVSSESESPEGSVADAAIATL